METHWTLRIFPAQLGLGVNCVINVFCCCVILATNAQSCEGTKIDNHSEVKPPWMLDFNNKIVKWISIKGLLFLLIIWNKVKFTQYFWPLKATLSFWGDAKFIAVNAGRLRAHICCDKLSLTNISHTEFFFLSAGAAEIAIQVFLCVLPNIKYKRIRIQNPSSKATLKWHRPGEVGAMCICPL